MRITIQNQGQFQKIQKKGVKEIVAERKSTLSQLSEKLHSNEGWSSFITQAVRPGFKFRLRFFFLFHVQSQIAVWSLGRMRHLCVQHMEFTEVVDGKS